jgi:hypothetical protein
LLAFADADADAENQKERNHGRFYIQSSPPSSPPSIAMTIEQREGEKKIVNNDPKPDNGQRVYRSPTITRS